MTENRVPTAPQPHNHDPSLCPECSRIASAQSAPPLDVVEVIESFRYSEPLVANTEPHRMWQRNEETLDAILAHLGSEVP